MEGVARSLCLRPRVNQMVSDIVGTRKLTAQKNLLSLLDYDLLARWTRAKSVTEPGEELRNQMGETRVKW